MRKMILSSANQIDFFSRAILLSVTVSFILSIYLLGNVILSYGAIYFLYFAILWITLFVILNEILLRKWLLRRISPDKKAVLITGCDRGFGFGFAKRLSEAGFQVFAGCLDPFLRDVLVLGLHPRIHCLKMDVTKPDEIQLALDYVTNHLQGNVLWAVINNAGISKGSDIETTSIQKIQDVLEVNLMGAIRVTKAFLPLLRESEGRVINIASAAGRLMLPGFLPYSMSKNALIAFSDGLRLEMKRHQVHVISVEPWIYRTKLSNINGISKQIETDWQSCSNSVKSTYNKEHVKSMKETARALFKWGVSSNLDEVIDVIQEAVTLHCPNYRYSPGKWYLNLMMWSLNFVPKPIADFVFCHFIFRR